MSAATGTYKLSLQSNHLLFLLVLMLVLVLLLLLLLLLQD
jgi:hypothetical protein